MDKTRLVGVDVTFMGVDVTSDFYLGLVMLDVKDGVPDGPCPYPMVFLDAYLIFYSTSVSTLFVCWPMAPLSQEKEAVRRRVWYAKTSRTDAYREKAAAWKKAKRAKTTRTDADRTKDAARQAARRARQQIAKQGLKELVNGATYRELQAVEIHDLLRDEKGNFVAPLKLPDMCQGGVEYPDTHLTERDKRNWFTKRLSESATFRSGCRHYLDGLLYEDLDESRWFVVEDGNCVINVKVQQADGSMKEEETQVRVFDSPTLLCDAQNTFFNFGEALSTCEAHVRGNCSDTGTMYGFGQRVYNGQLGDYAPLVSDMKTDSAKHWKAIALSGFCAAATGLLCVILNTWFPDESKLMRQVERDAGIVPGESMCGEDGATASMDVSCDLANAGHKDTGDASSGVATYTELYPGKAKNVSGSGSVNLYTMLNFISHLLAAVVFCLAKFEGCVRRKVL